MTRILDIINRTPPWMLLLAIAGFFYTSKFAVATLTNSIPVDDIASKGQPVIALTAIWLFLLVSYAVLATAGTGIALILIPPALFYSALRGESLFLLRKKVTDHDRDQRLPGLT